MRALQWSKWGYLRKITVCALVLSTVPLMLAGMQVYRYSARLLQQDAYSSSLQALAENRTRLNHELNLLQFQMVRWMQGDQAQAVLETEINAEHFILLNRAASEIGSMDGTGLESEEMLLLNLKLGWSYTECAGYRRLSPAQRTAFAGLLTTRGGEWFRGDPSWPGELHYLMPMPVYIKDVHAALVLCVKESALLKLLETEGDADDAHWIVQDGKRLAGGDLNGVDVEAVLTTLAAQQGESGYFILESEGTGRCVIWDRPRSGWTILTFLDMAVIMRNANAVFRYTSATCIVLLCASALVSILTSRGLYRPLRLLVRRAGGGVQGRDALVYLDARLSELVNSEEQVEALTEANRVQLREHYWFRLLGGFDAGLPPPAAIGLPDETAHKAVMVLQVSVDEKDGAPVAADLKSYVEAYLEQDLLVDAVVLHGHVVAILLLAGGGEASVRQALLARVSLMQQLFHSHLSLDASAGVGPAFRAYSEATASYRAAKIAADYDCTYGRSAATFAGDPPADAFLPGDMAAGVLRAMQAGDMGACEAEATAFAQRLVLASGNLAQLRHGFDSLAQKALALIERTNLALHASMPARADIAAALRQGGAGEMQQWLLETILRPAAAATGSMTPQRKLVLRMLALIQSRNEPHITLDELARALSYHANYLSHVFADEMGVSFSEYMVAFRIRRAKELLCGSAMQVQNIAESLGYSNTQNFIRVFRKLEGITPTQYRKAHGG